MAVNPKNFLLNTDYDMDKIIIVKTGSTIGTTEIPHNLGTTFLPFGVWSTDPNFSTVNSIGVNEASNEPSYTPRLGVDCDVFNNRIKILVSGGGADTTTVYYRIYGFAKPGDNISVASTSNLANKFMINTDYNYRKIFATGEFTQSDQEYSHNLGYLPQVMAWYDNSESTILPDFGVTPVMSASYFSSAGITVTPTKIKVGFVFPEEKVHWRIYYDEA